MLAATCLPRHRPLVAGLVVASEVPSLLRAASALARRRVNGDVLEASTLLLLTARRQFVAVGPAHVAAHARRYVVARTVVTGAAVAARRHRADRTRSSHRSRTVSADPVRVPTLRVGDVIVVEAGERLPSTAPSCAARRSSTSRR